MKIAVVYYSATGNVHALASALAAGAEDAGAQVRLRRVAELAPSDAIDANPQWRAHHDATAGLPVASHEDLSWADGYAFGTPSRFGAVAAQLKQFIDTTAPLWASGAFADKPVTVFGAAANAHGGQEASLLSLHTVMCHWGAVIVPPGYTAEVFSAAGGNPYGTSHTSEVGLPDAKTLAAARAQGERLARLGAALVESRSVPV